MTTAGAWVCDPKLRILLIAIRQACYIIADAIGEYLGLDPRVKRG